MADKRNKQLTVFLRHLQCPLLKLLLGPYNRIQAASGWSCSSQGYKPQVYEFLPQSTNFLFTLVGSVPVRLIRNPRGTSWDSFREELQGILERGPAGLGLANLSVQQALISACENKCPLKRVRTGRHSLKWTFELKCLRREVRRLFTKCRADKTPHSR